jgi:hypothetical protein
MKKNNIKGGRGLKTITQNGRTVILSGAVGPSSSSISADPKGDELVFASGSSSTSVITTPEWNRLPSSVENFQNSDKGPVVKLYSRFVYSPADDKFYGFYRLMYITAAGRIYKITEEFKEEIFLTSLHEHAI